LRFEFQPNRSVFLPEKLDPIRLKSHNHQSYRALSATLDIIFHAGNRSLGHTRLIAKSFLGPIEQGPGGPDLISCDLLIHIPSFFFNLEDTDTLYVMNLKLPAKRLKRQYRM